MANDIFYNPDVMSEADIKATFVARQRLVDDLVAAIRRQPDGAGVQHVVIVAPRGMGKTTVLLMVRFAVRDQKLSEQWQAIKFAEESYGINDLADFWIEILKYLAVETNDDTLGTRLESLKTQYPDADELQEAALALIKDWRRAHKKRLLLLVENFDLILEQINDERENARLREVLMNDGTMMLLGSATTFFSEARAYDQPLYNFFKIYNLNDLKFEDMRELLRQRAKLDGRADIDAVLTRNEGRLRALEHFTGGNPRLVLMLYRVVTHSELTEVQRALEKLLDEVTPYYKAKTESLPAQQRKILDHLARTASETGEGVTPTAIAEAVRITPNHASAQLKRLLELGYVRSANLRERSSYYVLSEPLYAVWYQMRFGRSARRRMQWLVNWLRILYTPEEMASEAERLGGHLQEHLLSGNLKAARDVLEHRYVLAEATADSSARSRLLEDNVRGYIALNDVKKVGELLPEINLSSFSPDTLKKLNEVEGIGLDQKVKVLHALAGRAYFAEWLEEALQYLNQIIEIKPDDHGACSNRGLVLSALGRNDEALASYDRALEFKPDFYEAWFNRGGVLSTLGRNDEALESYDRALEFKPDDHEAWYNRGNMLFALGRNDEALTSYGRALEVKPDLHQAWYNRGNMLFALGRNDEALASYGRALEFKPDLHQAWNNRGNVLLAFGRNDEALASYDRALEFKPDRHDVWFNRGNVLSALGQDDEALASYDRAFELNPDLHQAWSNRGLVLFALGRNDEALASYDRALEINPDFYQAWFNRGLVLSALGRNDEAIASYDRALEFKSDLHQAWSNRGLMLFALGRNDEALASYDRALEIKPDLHQAWNNRSLCLVAQFVVQIQNEELNLAKRLWNEAVESGRKSENPKWFKAALEILLEVARFGHGWFVRGLIADSGLDDEMFPLARALDYLLTGDEALIEKLTPEIRGIVEEIVRRLRDKVESPRKQPSAKKTGKGSRKRLSKRL